MGTSVRKTSEKIKKLLNKKIQEDPHTDLEDVIPEVAKETIRAKKTKSYFGDKDFLVLAGGGLSCYKRIAFVGYDEFIREFDFDPDQITVIQVQKIIEVILDDIEEKNGDIHSSFILNAFKIAMTNELLNRTSDPIVFLTSFCEVFLNMIIRENVNEELSNIFKNVTANTIDSSIERFSKDYVKGHFSDSILECLKNQDNISGLIADLQKELK